MFELFSIFNSKASETERGYTLIELLTVVSIMGFLVAIAWSAYLVYMDSAEYSKAEVNLRNMRPALELGEQQTGPGYSIPLTYSDTAGGPVIGQLKEILPGGTTSPELRLGVSYTACEPGESGATINAHLRAIPCNSSRMITWTRLCNGVDFFQHNVVNPGCS